MEYIKNLEEPHCGNCRRFLQHYILDGKNGYKACNCGHCVYPRIKRRVGICKACEHYQEKPKPPKPMKFKRRPRYF